MAYSIKLKNEKLLYAQYKKAYNKLKKYLEEDCDVVRVFCEICSERENHKEGQAFSRNIENVGQVDLSIDLTNEVRSIGAIVEAQGMASFQGKVRYVPSKPGLFGMEIDEDYPMIGEIYSIKIEYYGGERIKDAILEEVSKKEYRFAGHEGYHKMVYLSFVNSKGQNSGGGYKAPISIIRSNY